MWTFLPALKDVAYITTLQWHRCFVDEAQRILRAHERSSKPKFGALRSLICPGIEAQQVRDHSMPSN